ncbi:MAG: FliO/MopB family protein [Fibrobacter sp.]|nr:FliO/MopB family protein [Fibrobacter sp.]
MRVLLFLLLSLSFSFATETLESSSPAALKFQNLQKVLDAETDTNKSQAANVSERPKLGDIALRMTLSLAVVLLLIYVLYRLAKKMRKMDLPPSAGGKNLQLLETYHLGSQQKIVLLRLGESRVILLGASDENISTLSEIAGEEALNIIAGSSMQAENNSTQFSETVNQMLSRFRRED